MPDDEHYYGAWNSWANLEAALFCSPYIDVDAYSKIPLKEFDFSVVTKEGLKLYAR